MIKLLLKYFIILSVTFYRRFISPLIVPSCRFFPSCSNYAIQAVEKHGIYRGFLFAMKRVFRCHPFHCKAGYDPVP
jgi:putative membrane protein insertion efficiency factor